MDDGVTFEDEVSLRDTMAQVYLGMRYYQISCPALLNPKIS